MSPPAYNFFLSRHRSIIRMFVFVAGILAILGGIWHHFAPNTSKQLVILLDNSLSMSVKDISSQTGAISRLDASKMLLLSFINAHPSTPMAIASFANGPFLHTPISTSASLHKNIIANISPVWHNNTSNITETIAFSERLYREHPGITIAIISDMEFFETIPDTIPTPPNANFLWIGVGTKKGGSILQSYTQEGTPQYLQFQDETVISKMDISMLHTLAKRTNGTTKTYTTTTQIDTLNQDIFSTPALPVGTNIPSGYIILGILLLIVSLSIRPYYLLQ